jgi:hypothetical protein
MWWREVPPPCGATETITKTEYIYEEGATYGYIAWATDVVSVCCLGGEIGVAVNSRYIMDIPQPNLQQMTKGDNLRLKMNILKAQFYL